jgi:hypothetical protein
MFKSEKEEGLRWEPWDRTGMMYHDLEFVACLYRVLKQLGWNRYTDSPKLRMWCACIQCWNRLAGTVLPRPILPQCRELVPSWAGTGTDPPKSWSHGVPVPIDKVGLKQVLIHPSLVGCGMPVPNIDKVGLEQVLIHPSLTHVACLCRIMTKLGWNRCWSTQNLAHVACLYQILTNRNRFCTTQVLLTWCACTEYWQCWAWTGLPPKSRSCGVLVPSAETSWLVQVYWPAQVSVMWLAFTEC